MPTVIQQHTLKHLEMGCARFLYGLDKVPDDKLNFRPGDAGKTPLQLATRLAMFLGFFHKMFSTKAALEGRPTPPEDFKTRDEAKTALAEVYSGLRTAVEQLSEEDLEIRLPAPWGTMIPISEWHFSALEVQGYFQGQLNFCQLTYGDEEPNIPPEWMK